MVESYTTLSFTALSWTSAVSTQRALLNAGDMICTVSVNLTDFLVVDSINLGNILVVDSLNIGDMTVLGESV